MGVVRSILEQAEEDLRAYPFRKALVEQFEGLGQVELATGTEGLSGQRFAQIQENLPYARFSVAAIEEALEQMTEEQAAFAQLRWLNSPRRRLSMREIADELGVSEGTAYRLRRMVLELFARRLGLAR